MATPHPAAKGKACRSESLLGVVLTDAHEAVLVHDLEGRLLEANHIACRRLGRSADELIGANMREIESPASADPLQRRLDLVLRTGSYHGRATLVSSGGTDWPVDLRCLLIEREGGPAVLCLTRDVQEVDASDRMLDENEDPYALALEAVSDGVWDYDCRTQRFRRNEHWYQLTGYARGELEAWETEHGTIIHPDDVWRLGDAWLRCETGQSEVFRAEIRLRHKSGQWRWILGRGRVIEHGPNGEPWRIIGTDTEITEQKRAEEALRQSKEEYRLISENIPVAVYSALPDEHSTNLFLSGRIEELTGYAEHELMADPTLWGCIIHGDDAERVWQAIAEHRRTRSPLDVEYRIVTRDGEVKWIRDEATPMLDEAGEIVRIDGFMEDITEQKRAEEALRDSEDLLRGAIDADPNSIFVKDKAGRYVLVNEEQARLYGTTPSEMVGKTDADFAQTGSPLTQEVDDFVTDDLEVIESRQVKFIPEEPFTLSDGTTRWFQTTKAPLTLGGHTECVLGVAVDVTARKRAEEERRELEAQVQHAQKLESLGVLAGGIAHDFNNLLAGILGNADLALTELPAGSPVRDNIEEIKTASRRAADLTRQMLAYSGKGRYVVTALDLNALVREMAHLLRASISKKAVLTFDLADDLPAAEADAAQVQQVVMNLITNASDAIGDAPGVIAMQTGVMEPDAAFLAQCYAADGMAAQARCVFVEVGDTGCGMDETTRARVFDPFFTTKFAGRGLGLAAVLGIVRAHGGAIKLDSEPGKGTTFRVLFPASERPVERPTPSGPRRTWKGTGTMLVVDDEQLVGNVAKRILEHAGFDVLIAREATVALELFRAHADRVAAVLLDMTMPEMSGEEVYRELRQIKPGVPVILTSGYSESDALGRFADAGLAGFVHKPFEVDTLIGTVRHALGQ